MTTVHIYGFTVGNFREDGAALLSNPWGIVSLVDLYVGFILFLGWIIYREDSHARTVVWVVLKMVLGFFTGVLYTLVALQTSSGANRRCFMGATAYPHGR
jgi:hypothetical protein